MLRPSPFVECWCGGVLLSHILSDAVPSPCQVFASGFGMGPGVSPGPWPPQICNYHPVRLACGGVVVGWGPDGGRVCVLRDRSVMRGVSPRHPSKVIVSFVLPPFVGWCVCCRSTVSTGQLHPLRGFHVRPIDHVFCMESPDPRRGHGILISEQASRLDAFSGYPSRT